MKLSHDNLQDRFNEFCYQALKKKDWDTAHLFCTEWVMNRYNDNFDSFRKVRLQKQLDECAVDGEVAVEVWQRDCDMCEGTHLCHIEATVEAMDRLEESVAEGAEGPYSLSILTPKEAEEFRSYSRDRALEAFEDGHPHIIY